MEIYYRKKVVYTVHTHSELETFLKDENIYKFFIKFPYKEVDRIQYEIDNTQKLSYKEIKPWIKKILDYPESIYHPRFLYCMGWDDSSIVNFISEKQKNNSKILSDKKRKNPENYFSSTTSNIQYWLSKGYSIDEAKIKLSNRQKTFSREICIQKYGENEGLNKFNERQKKWVNSLQKLPNYHEIQRKKNLYDYDKQDINYLVEISSFTEKTKSLILKYIDCKTIDEFVENIINEIDIKRYSDVQPYFNSLIIGKKYNKSVTDIKNLFLLKIPYSISKQVYGTPIYHNGIRFKSTKEYQLAIFFESINIEYIYEKNYPNSNFKCDFFIPKKNCYVEYYGMLDGKKENHLDDKQIFYKKKMEEKNEFCQKNNLFLVQNTNYNELINELKQILCV